MARPMVSHDDDDHYATLHVAPHAPIEAIREAYRKLALKFHPDKNRDESATADFQRLGRAWEALKDPARREDYDRARKRRRRRREDEAEDEDDDDDAESEAKRRRQEADPEVAAQWGEWMKSGTEKEKEKDGDADTAAAAAHADRAARREKARAWKNEAQADFLQRRQAWDALRKDRVFKMLMRQGTVRQLQGDLDNLLREEERAADGDAGDDFAQRSKARQGYISKLKQVIKTSHSQLKQLLGALETGRRRYEQAETTSRTQRIAEALELLGPRDWLSSATGGKADRRGQSINHWTALSRVRTDYKMRTTSIKRIQEGLWHSTEDWERLGGEQTCHRCSQHSFHVILECGPAKCPGCGIVVCGNCYRDLKLLQEYERWMGDTTEEVQDSLYDLDFDRERAKTTHQREPVEEDDSAWGPAGYGVTQDL